MATAIASPVERLLTFVRDKGAIRPQDAKVAGIHPEYMRRLERQGILFRVSRGLYTLAELDTTEHHGLALAARRVPHGVVCLLSALLFHDVGTQLPFEVWMAVDVKARRPRLTCPPLRVVRMSGPALSEGIETHVSEGVPVRVYSVAKTVVDCFKYRNRVGLDVALGALHEAWKGRRATMAELWRYAEIDRVANVMRPYLESVVL